LNDQAIFTEFSETITIENNICRVNNYNGIYFQNTHKSTIFNNNLTLNYLTGINLYFSNGNILLNNSCFNNEYEGINLYESDHNLLENNVCINNYGHGVQLQYSNNNTLIGGKCKYNSDNGLYFLYYSHDNSITEYICENNYDYGFSIILSSRNYIAKNYFSYNDNYGIYTSWSKLNTIENNYCYSNSDTGIILYWSNNNTIENNTCYYNNYGISITYTSNDNEISNNICNNNYYNGLYLDHSDRLIVSNNSFNYNSDSGLWLFDCQFNIIENNSFISNNDYGIYFRAYSYWTPSLYNVIKSNAISDNDYGIYLDDYAYYNYIYYNNFISNNYYQARDYGYNNQWYNEYNEGNFWSDYYGLDNGVSGRIKGDGIGDTNLPHYGLDYYPFTQQSGWLNPGIAYIFEPDDVKLDAKYSISWLRCRCAIKYILIEDTSKDFGDPTEVYEGSDLSCEFEAKTEGTYYYRLRAYFDGSESDWSNSVNITIFGPPKKPKNVQVTPYPGGNALIISWTQNSGKVKDYQLQCKTTGDWELVDILPHPMNEYNHTGLTDGTTYSYRIRAKDVWGQESQYTVAVDGIPKDSTAPAPPKNPRLTVLDYDSIKIRWDNNIYDEDLVGYNIYRTSAEKSTSWGEPVNGDAPVDDSSYIDTGLDELTTYFYVVTAVDEVPNESGYTKIVSDSTTLGPHAPEVKAHPAEVKLDEDTIDTTIDLYSWFKDINGDRLKFRSEGEVNINVVISQQTGKVKIEPVPGWNGQETVTFYANDSKYEISTEVTIIIKSVNDPPGIVHILEPAEGSYYKETETVNFMGQCHDPDVPYGDFLTFKWSSDLDGMLGIGENLSDIKLSKGIHMITLEVSDSAQSKATTSINIMITEEITDGKKNRDSGLGLGSNFLLFLIIIIIIVIVLVAVFFGLKKRRGKQGEYIEVPGDTPAIDEDQYIDQYDTNAYEGSADYEYQNNQEYGHREQMQQQQQQQQQQQYYQGYQNYQGYQGYQDYQDLPQEQARWYDDGSEYYRDQGYYDDYSPEEVPVEELNVDWEMKQEQSNEAEVAISDLIEE
jgi:parallel beta-helix repeat protein